MSHTAAHVARLFLVVACLLGLPGCTTALTTASLQDALQDALWEKAEHAVAADSAAGKEPAEEDDAAPDAVDSLADDIAADRADADRRRAAIEEAMERLARIGTLDAATQAALVETLQATEQEDWPVVIEAFAATLAEAAPAAAVHVVAKAAAESPAAAAQAEPSPPEPPAAAPPAPEAVAVKPAVQEPPALESPAPAAPAAEPAPQPAAVESAATQSAAVPPAPAPTLAVRNACFATRVQAWGVVDRFAEDRFRPGQEVIVYFELDGLAAGESPAGFTTCIDTSLRLVADDGRELHAWRFEPLAETCVSRRRDYFARYVVQLPESAAGGCRVEVAVTDTVAGATASAAIPCHLE